MRATSGGSLETKRSVESQGGAVFRVSTLVGLLGCGKEDSTEVGTPDTVKLSGVSACGYCSPTLTMSGLTA